jgi:hypothetical protein
VGELEDLQRRQRELEAELAELRRSIDRQAS